METKTCVRCHLVKSRDEFRPSKQNKDGLYSYCNPCEVERKREWRKNNREKSNQYHREYNKKWRADNRDRVARSDRKQTLRKYGLTIEDYDRMVVEQEGRCAICNLVTDLVVDHNHETGANRDLLCGNCNKGIGNLKESEEILMGAIMYLRKHQ